VGILKQDHRPGSGTGESIANYKFILEKAAEKAAFFVYRHKDLMFL
jgi:hypothetical protein